MEIHFLSWLFLSAFFQVRKLLLQNLRDIPYWFSFDNFLDFVGIERFMLYKRVCKLFKII